MSGIRKTGGKKSGKEGDKVNREPEQRAGSHCVTCGTHDP